MSVSIKKEYPFHIAWFNEQGVCHREDGPTIEWDDGCEDWWHHGVRQRIGGPAIEYNNGNKCWYVNDNRHRLNGPTIIVLDGDYAHTSWFVRSR